MAAPQYQQRDKEVVNYQLYEIPGVPVQVRGPRQELTSGQYIACFGAAQTFGPLCAKPWPALLAESRHPTLNLGFGGAGPSFFLLNPKLIQLANRSRLAIVQVMAGRSTRNSYLEIDGGRSNARPRGSREGFVATEIAYQRVLQAIGPRATQFIVEETRRNWVYEMELLLEAIRVPSIVFWFSERPPHYREGYGTVGQFMGKFPQLVTEAMVEQIRPKAAAYVECISSRGMPHLLRNMTTGEPALVALGNNKQPRDRNTYYPSPEMHEDAAAALLAAIRDVVSSRRAEAPEWDARSERE